MSKTVSSRKFHISSSIAPLHIVLALLPNLTTLLLHDALSIPIFDHWLLRLFALVSSFSCLCWQLVVIISRIVGMFIIPCRLLNHFRKTCGERKVCLWCHSNMVWPGGQVQHSWFTLLLTMETLVCYLFMEGWRWDKASTQRCCISTIGECFSWCVW